MEASNKTLLTALKKRLDSAKGKWVDELSKVLWAYRTTARKPTGISPFAITYGMEATILTEIGIPTIRTYVPKQGNTYLMVKDLDTLDELRESAAICIASYQRRLANSYNKRVKPRTFQPGNLVLRRVFENTVDPNVGKFQPNWEGLTGPDPDTLPGFPGWSRLVKFHCTIPRECTKGPHLKEK